MKTILPVPTLAELSDELAVSMLRLYPGRMFGWSLWRVGASGSVCVCVSGSEVQVCVVRLGQSPVRYWDCWEEHQYKCTVSVVEPLSPASRSYSVSSLLLLFANKIKALVMNEERRLVQSDSHSLLLFIRRRSTGYQRLAAPSLRPSPPPPQRPVGGEECPCPPSPPLLLLLHCRLHFLHFLLPSPSLLLPPPPLLLLLLLPPLPRSLAPGEESGVAAGPAAAEEEAEEGYGVCWSSLHGAGTAERKRGRQKNRRRK